MTLSPPLRGVLWMVSAAFFFTAMLAMVRVLSADLSIPQIVFVRSVVGAAIFLPILLRGGIAGMRPNRPWMVALRGVVLMGGMMGLYTGVSLMAFSDASALSFLVPLFTVIAAVVFLRERAGWQIWGAVLVGFAGAMVIVQPGPGVLQPAALLVILSAMFYACDNVAVKVLARTESASLIVFYVHVGSLALALAVAVFDWRPIDAALAPEILAIGIFASIAHVSLARGSALLKASVAVGITFLRLPFTALIAFVAFGEPTQSTTWAGAAVICAATLYITRRATRRGRAAAE